MTPSWLCRCAAARLPDPGEAGSRMVVVVTAAQGSRVRMSKSCVLSGGRRKLLNGRSRAGAPAQPGSGGSLPAGHDRPGSADLHQMGALGSGDAGCTIQMVQMADAAQLASGPSQGGAGRAGGSERASWTPEHLNT